MQPFAKQQNVFGRIIGVTEVREKEARGFTLEDCGEGSIPDPEIDVGRWSGGHDEGIPLDAHSRGIANEGDVFRLIEVADVVRGMARRVDDFDSPRAEREGFTALEDAQILPRNGKSFTEQALQFVGPAALCAGKT